MDNAGNFTAAGNVTAYSDIRLKTNIHSIKNALKTVEQMTGVYYNRTSDEEGPRKVGFIAQDLLNTLPEVVHKNDDSGFLSVDYGNITALLVEAIKEQQVLIKELTAKVEELSKR